MEVTHVVMPECVQCPHEVRPDNMPSSLEESRRETIRARRLIQWQGFNDILDFCLDEAVT
jgi:hypothetical protein